MKLAVLSCIHGNLEALDTVLHDVETQGCDRIICLGDLVGYGPYPNEVVDRIRSLEIPTVQGCWDEDIVEGSMPANVAIPPYWQKTGTSPMNGPIRWFGMMCESIWPSFLLAYGMETSVSSMEVPIANMSISCRNSIASSP